MPRAGLLRLFAVLAPAFFLGIQGCAADGTPEAGRASGLSVEDAGADAPSADAGPAPDAPSIPSDDAGALPDAPPPPPSPSACPASPPSAGDRCETPYLFCDWGDDPRLGCRQLADCRPDPSDPDRATWQFVDAFACPEPAPSCPPSAPTSMTCDKSQRGMTCVYDDTAFTCAPCIGNFCVTDHGALLFRWLTTQLESGCPSTVPHGGPCDSPGLLCDYNSCANDCPAGSSCAAPWDFSVALKCTNDGWRLGTVYCP